MTEKTCLRCGVPFKCNHENVERCQCSKVQLTFAASYFIKHQYGDCLCGACLREINASCHPYAMYIHGFGSGARSTSSTVVARRIDGYEWLRPELPLQPEQALELLQEHVRVFEPELIIGSSMGGMFACYVNAPNAVKVVVNPGMEMDKALRRRGYGKFDFLCEREDGVQQGLIDEPLIRSYERFRAEHQVSLGKKNFAVMAKDDELLGHQTTRENAELLASLGFEIEVSDRFHHRLNEDTAKLILNLLRTRG